MKSVVRDVSLAVLTVMLAAAGGWLVARTGLPLAWMVGAMLTTAIASFARFPVRQSEVLMRPIRASIGTMIGAAVTMELVRSFPDWWGSLAFLVLAMAVMGVIVYALLRRVARFDRPSAALCAIPGGIAEMILLAPVVGADQRRVAIVHALRIAITVLVLPVLIGVFAGAEFTRAEPGPPYAMSAADWAWFALCIAIGVAATGLKALPAPAVLVTLVVSALIHVTGLTAFEVPPAVTTAVQVFIGVMVGARFRGVTVREISTVFGAALMVVGLQIAIAFASALLVAHHVGWNVLDLILAYAPGGLAEMSLIALSMGAAPAFVGFHHVFRVLVALCVAPVMRAAFAPKGQPPS